MATTITQANLDAMMDTLNTGVGANPNLVFYTVADAEVATCPFTGSGVRSPSGGREIITFAHASFTDDASATGGTVSYAALETSAGAEVVRFSDPVNDIGLSSATITAGDTVDINADIVVQSPAYT